MKRQRACPPALESLTVAILGYGNQGRAQALNLRDHGVKVVVGGRPNGKGISAAQRDGFEAFSLEEAAMRGDLPMLLLPDSEIGAVHDGLRAVLAERSVAVGLSHGYAYHFGLLEPIPEKPYLLVGPKASGYVLRERFELEQKIPTVIAVAGARADKTQAVWELARAYALAIGSDEMHDTTFQEETECDLFGEQTVLCGGMMELMRVAYQTLTRAGHSPEMAFYETCFEARLILDLFLKFGPREMLDRISPTAAYGGHTRGRRVLHPEVEKQMADIFSEIRSGAFASEWKAEVEAGAPSLVAAKAKAAEDALQAGFEQMHGKY